jgi:uncharacterized protein YegL
VRLEQDFVTADRFQVPALHADGLTPMGTGLVRALDLIANRKKKYKANGVAYYRLWVVLIMDGAPQGEELEAVRQAAERVRAQEAAGKSPSARTQRSSRRSRGLSGCWSRMPFTRWRNSRW